MRKRMILVLDILIFIMFQCGKDETVDTPTGFTELEEVSEIIFGSGWRASDSAIINIDTIFSQQDTIRYQVKFVSALPVWFMVKKEWIYNYTLLFSATIPVPNGTKRICGEFRRYDGQPLGPGIYEISILYFHPDSGRYVSARYQESVNRRFKIQ